MNQNPTDFSISVIIPAFNAALYLGQAIDSVLNQTVQPCEIIIVDDGSTDNTLAVASSYISKGIKLIQKKHQGIADTRNIGVKESKGNYLAFLDADDLWHTQKLEKQIDLFKKNPIVSAVFANVQQFISPDLSEDKKKCYTCPDTPQVGYHAGSLLISRAAFLHVGFFSEQLSAGEFIEWYLRAKQKSIFFEMLPEVLMYRRIHGNNTVLLNSAKVNIEYLKIVRSHFSVRDPDSKS
jgi:glycosyltransferase involved in cell wall biosynthesis